MPEKGSEEISVPVPYWKRGLAVAGLVIGGLAAAAGCSSAGDVHEKNGALRDYIELLEDPDCEMAVNTSIREQGDTSGLNSDACSDETHGRVTNVELAHEKYTDALNTYERTFYAAFSVGAFCLVLGLAAGSRARR